MDAKGFACRSALQLVIQVVGDETLIYNEQTHHAYCLNAVSTAVWKACDGTLSTAQMAEQLTVALMHPVSEEIVLLAVEELRQLGLVAAGPEPAPLDALSRRTLMQRAGAGAVMMLPLVAMIAAPKAAEAY